ncbi:MULTISPECIES: YbaB/EbfC family nucleoid-associated protein [Xanthobacter]|uniref:YbaB/EbfC family nucleoid-associated protein n=1 Tax=Xanthobacter TaxID=279 RepID=UPI001F02969E|nr:MULTISPECIES: YbaB/EbfC family nucleoid-associated protein [unclassified Xanthobacter]
MRDLFGMMKQAKELQERMQQMQAELDTIEVEGASGGGLVTARVTAKGECKAVRIDPSLVKPDEVEILEDLIVAALADARGKAERVMQEKMQGLTGGLSLPPGMKLF